MKLSEWLANAKQQQAKTGEPVKAVLTKELAQEIFNDLRNEGRPVSLVQEAYWATRILTGNFVPEKSLILFDEQTNELTDGGQRLAGFLGSGQQQLETFVYFCGDKYELTTQIIECFYKH